MRWHSVLVEVSINLSVSLQRKAGSLKISLSGIGDLKQHYEPVGEKELWGSWVFEKAGGPRMEQAKAQGAGFFLWRSVGKL